jgi:hypothetical protein
MAGEKRVDTVVIDDNEHGPLTKGQVLEGPGFLDWKSISEY